MRDLFQALSFSYLEGVERNTEINEERAAIKDCTKGLTFANTPHRGADPAHWPAMASKLAKFTPKDCSDKLVQSLVRGSDVAERLQSNFKDIIRSFAVYTLFEELRYPGVGIVVEKDSALFGHSETTIPIHANHSDMVKFSDRTDNNYKKGFRNVISNIVRNKIERRASAEHGMHPD